MKSLRKRAIAKSYGLKFSEVNNMYKFSNSKGYFSGSKDFGYKMILDFAIDDFKFVDMSKEEQEIEMKRFMENLEWSNM